MTVRPNRDAGFTLIEVLVAFAILAFTLAAAYGVFSDAARAVASGERYGVALALAESRLAAVDAAPAGEAWDDAGEFDGTYRWRVETRVLPDGPPVTVRIEPVVVTVTVTWESGGPVALETVRLRRR
ncbi:MAG: prepilin-type N-terminal cleavage/methylation domain-containing protein [Alphaproteobacteria bacterium]|nr:prepilin-type N-terminal cleavage/methylation domain-containing protein [Alphaproteobacteria bacterium]